MNLFDILPSNLFNVLVGPSKVVCIDILMMIYESYGIEPELLRATITDKVEHYIENLNSASFSEGLTEDVKKLIVSDDPRKDARYLLGRIEEAGWLNLETKTDWTEVYHIPGHAYMLLEIFSRILLKKDQEYQGYVFATYSALLAESSSKERDDGSFALETAFTQTKALEQGLKNLRDNIGTHIETLIEQKTPNEVLDLLLNYKSNIIERNYHRLKTSDHVSRYRPKIRAIISDLFSDDDWIKRTAQQDIDRGISANLSDAINSVRTRLKAIDSTYHDLDRYYRDIDRKNASYSMATREKISRFVNVQQNIHGNLVDILQALSDSEEMDKPSLSEGDLAIAFSLYKQDFLDNDSLYTPRRHARRHQPSAIIRLNYDDKGALQKKRKEIVLKKLQKFTLDKANQLVDTLLAGRSECCVSEVPLQQQDDIFKVIALINYSKQKGAIFNVSWGESEYVNMVGYQCPNYVISRREVR